MSRRRRFGDLDPTRSDVEAEVDEELTFHVEMRTKRLVDDGVAPERARELALERFGAYARVRDECVGATRSRGRKVSRRRIAAEVIQDLRHAVRSLMRRPTFTAAALLTLAIGIGANVAMFSLIDAILLRPLPYDRPEELVVVWPEGGRASLAELDYLRAGASWSALEAHDDGEDFTLTGRDVPLKLRGVATTPGLFRTLGVGAGLGRLFDTSDAEPGADGVVVLSEPAFRTRFGGDPALLGTGILLDGKPYTVIGVTPPGFHYPDAATDLWLPLSTAAPKDGGFYWGSMFLKLVGRLADGVSAGEAGAETRLIAARLNRDNPIWTPGETYGADASVEPLQINLAGELRSLSILLMAAVAAVLLIVCVNLANLLLARSSVRERETAIRTSLGASRLRILVFHLSESLALAAGGTVLGLGLAQAILIWLVSHLPGAEARFGAIGLDVRVLGFAVGLAFVTAIAFGLGPALRSIRADLRASLHGAGSGGPRATALLRRVLVTAQIALALVLVVSAGLLITSFWDRWRTETGFRSEGVLIARLDPAEALYEEPLARARFYERVVERAGALPGVVSAAVASRLPMADEDSYLAHRVEGLETEQGHLPMARTQYVGPGYFRTLGIPLRAGRDVTGDDLPESKPVVLVNRALAESIWPGEDPVGKRVGDPWPGPWIEVVGVVENVRQDAVGGTIEPTLYFPYAQRPTASASLLVHASVEPTSLGAPLRAIVQEIDDQVPVGDVRTLEGHLWASVAGPRLTATLLIAFAAVALVLGGLGIYGVIAFVVEARRREIGVRMALGASPRAIARRVIGDGAVMAATGVAVGLAAALAAQRLLAGFLYEARAVDLRVLLAAGAILGVTALVASLAPARRAAAIDPIRSLRDE